MKTILLILTLSGLGKAAPKPPVVWELSPKEIREVSIHSEINTMLIFPKEVTLSMGHGLTDGSTPGVVLQEHAKDKRVLVWRHLGGAENILVQVMLGQKAYAFRIVPSTTPESIVHFVEDEGRQPAEKVVLPTGQTWKDGLNRLEKRELLNLARSSAILKDRIPHKYEGFQARALSNSHQEVGLRVSLQKAARFANQDALIMIGTVTNQSDQLIELNQRKPYLVVGAKRQYWLSDLSFGKAQLSPRGQTTIEVILVGDGRGNQVHLSLENLFRIRLLP